MTNTSLPSVPEEHSPTRVHGAPTARLSAVCTALAIGLVLASSDASALTLGRLQVKSALGQPLNAQIEVSQITPAEAEGLRLRVASPAAFNASGIPYNPVLSNIQLSLQKVGNGRYVVQLFGNRPMNEPFIDLLVEADWNSGRIVRDYTVLLDPPAALRQAAPVAPTAPQLAAAPRVPVPQVAPASRRRAPALAVAPAPAPAPAPAVATTGGQVTVQRGDTAGRIAAANKPADISLDQMLVAMLRANPSAFIGGNVNRIKAGAVLDMPSAADLSASSSTQARRTVRAQSRDFNGFRQSLAENAPTAGTPAADRAAAGKLEASVEERNAASASPDKLKISQGQSAADQLAKTKEAEAAAQRAAELSKNVKDLNTLQAAAGAAAPVTAGDGKTVAPAATAPANAPVSGAAAPTTTPMAPSAATGSATPNASSATGATPATAADAASVTSAPAPAATPAVVAPKPAVAPPAERGFFADLMDNPLLLAALALLAALLAFLAYRVMGRRRDDSGDSVFLESKVPRDSFFGVSGGQQIDTQDRSSSLVSSLSYSPSQLDAGDVDPVAEADVYLAYGRDLQAEEILREAQRTSPDRLAIPIKLLEIHAKRRDALAFEELAQQLQEKTGGAGADWVRVVEMGRDLDPGNPLYQNVMPSTAKPAGATANYGAGAAAAAVGMGAAAASASRAGDHAKPDAKALKVAPVDEVVETQPPFVPSVAPLDFDLDLSIPPTEAKPAVKPMAKATPAATPVEYTSTKVDPKPEADPWAPTAAVGLGGSSPDAWEPTVASKLSPATSATAPKSSDQRPGGGDEQTNADAFAPSMRGASSPDAWEPTVASKLTPATVAATSPSSAQRFSGVDERAKADAFAPTMRDTLRGAPGGNTQFPSTIPGDIRPSTPFSPEFDLDFDQSVTAPGDLETTPASLDTTPGGLAGPTNPAELLDERAQPATLRAGLPGDSGFIEFDMTKLSQQRESISEETTRGELEPMAPRGAEHPHAIKLSLARELQALGDDEGARSLAEEVVEDTSGELRDEAKALLAQLS